MHFRQTILSQFYNSTEVDLISVNEESRMGKSAGVLLISPCPYIGTIKKGIKCNNGLVKANCSVSTIHTRNQSALQLTGM